MPIGVFTMAGIYIIVWWTVLFAVLPFGTRPEARADDTSGWRGVPARPMLGRKLLATTLLAGVVWLGLYLLITSGWIDVRNG